MYQLDAEELALVLNALQIAQRHCAQTARSMEDAAVLARYRGDSALGESQAEMMALMVQTADEYAAVRTSLSAQAMPSDSSSILSKFAAIRPSEQD